MTGKTRYKRPRIETYICPECGRQMFVPRRNRREKDHVKDMWCVFCQKKTKFVKQEEYDGDQFKEKGQTR